MFTFRSVILPREKKGLEVLSQVERIAKRQVVVFTPVGMLPSPTDEKFYKLNRWDECYHKSSWTVEDFVTRGYLVNGVNGLCGLRNRKGKIRFKGLLRVLGAFLSYASQIWTFHNPRIAFEIVCVKNLNGAKDQ